MLDFENLPVCEDCPRIGRVPCIDGKVRCVDCAKVLARRILKASRQAKYCSTPKARKARAKRRAARKAKR